MKKLLVILLAVVMLVSAVACTSNGNKTPADTNNNNKNPQQSENGTDNSSEPDLPEIEFGGASFRVHTKQGTLETEVFADEATVDPLKVSIYERNAAVEDLYDVVIEPVISYDGSVSGQASEMIDILLAESDEYDIGLSYAVGVGPLVTGGYLVNWLNLEYTDLSKQYWIYDANKSLIFDDAIYTVVGDMCTTALTYTYAMYYNRSEGDRILDEDGTKLTEIIFDKIADKEWTLDYFTELVSGVYNDIDETPGRSDGDFYGFTAEYLTNLDIWPFALNIPITSYDEENGLHSVFKTEKTAQAVDMINRLYWETPGSNTDYGMGQSGTPINNFVAGNALFLTSWLGNAFNALTNMDEQYTILPYPMFDDEQEQYMTGAMDNFSMITIPYTAPDLTLVSVIVEALNYESRKTVYPAYYEDALQKRYTRDPESIEMLDIIMDGRTFDLATSLVTNLAMCFRSAVASKENNFNLFYDNHAENYDTQIESIVEQYEINKAMGR